MYFHWIHGWCPTKKQFAPSGILGLFSALWRTWRSSSLAALQWRVVTRLGDALVFDLKHMQACNGTYWHLFKTRLGHHGPPRATGVAFWWWYGYGMPLVCNGFQLVWLDTWTHCFAAGHRGTVQLDKNHVSLIRLSWLRMLSKSRWGMSGVSLYRLKNKRDMPMSCSWLSQLAECFAAQHVFAWFCNCGVRRDRNEDARHCHPLL